MTFSPSGFACNAGDVITFFALPISETSTIDTNSDTKLYSCTNGDMYIKAWTLDLKDYPTLDQSKVVFGNINIGKYNRSSCYFDDNGNDSISNTAAGIDLSGKDKITVVSWLLNKEPTERALYATTLSNPQEVTIDEGTKTISIPGSISVPASESIMVLELAADSPQEMYDFMHNEGEAVYADEPNDGLRSPYFFTINDRYEEGKSIIYVGAPKYRSNLLIHSFSESLNSIKATLREATQEEINRIRTVNVSDGGSGTITIREGETKAHIIFTGDVEAMSVLYYSSDSSSESYLIYADADGYNSASFWLSNGNKVGDGDLDNLSLEYGCIDSWEGNAAEVTLHFSKNGDFPQNT